MILLLLFGMLAAEGQATKADHVIVLKTAKGALAVSELRHKHDTNAVL